jgi:hypothetical protein
MLPKWKAEGAWKPSGAIQKLKDVKKIAVDTQVHERNLPATACTIVQGNRRLMKPQNASLMIIASADRLHTCGSSDCAHLCDLIFIIGLGLPVALASTWRTAGGHPSRLPAKDPGLFLHASAAKKKPFTFMLGSFLADTYPELGFALWQCTKQDKSQWKVIKDKGQRLATPFVRADSIKQLAAAIFKLRTLEEDGCRGYAFGAA